MGNILFVDDDQGIISTFGLLIRGSGHRMRSALDAHEALDFFKKGTFDLVLSDLRMPGTDGLGFLQEIRHLDPHVGFIMLTAYPSSSTAVRAIKLLADDYIEKPILDFDGFSDILTSLILRVKDRRGKQEEAVFARKNDSHEGGKGGPALHENRSSPPNGVVRQEDLFGDLETPEGFMDFIGTSPAMRNLYRMIKKMASSTATVLIKGETGTGKEMVARTIHQISSRKDKPFIPVHCAAIPETLLATELFGHEKGAFTGADKLKKGLFEAADGGTLFLDEIGEVPQAMQIKLLRVLQEKEIMRVGSCKVRNVDVRIIVASNKDLLSEVNNGRFREDLYFRLDVLSITVPPLRQRCGDIEMLIDYYIRKLAVQYHKKGITYPPEALMPAVRYGWPGNVRELLNVIERAVIMEEGGTVSSFPINLSGMDKGRIAGEIRKEKSFKSAKRKMVEKFEREYLAENIEKKRGNVTAAASAMGIDVKTVWRKVKQYGLKIR